jgi:hypothetical protein
VTRQGYYAWKRRPPSARELADRKLCERIRQIHLETEEIYGAPRIYSELKLVDGIAVGKKRVARLMRQLGIRGADGRRGGVRTTVRDPKRDSAPDLVDRDFARAEPNRLWVCDLKYVQTGQGFLFLAAVQDVFSRRIIGWSMRDDLKSELVLDALGMAVSARGADAAGVVAHSDHGSLGGFKWSSQHLDRGGGGWDVRRVGVRRRRGGRRCGRRGVRRCGVVSTARGSGTRSKRVPEARMPPWRSGCRRRLAPDGSVRLVGCAQSAVIRSRVVTSRSPSGRRSRSSGRKERAFARSLAV